MAQLLAFFETGCSTPADLSGITSSLIAATSKFGQRIIK
jgi:hypothetical protein